MLGLFTCLYLCKQLHGFLTLGLLASESPFAFVTYRFCYLSKTYVGTEHESLP